MEPMAGPRWASPILPPPPSILSPAGQFQPGSLALPRVPRALCPSFYLATVFSQSSERSLSGRVCFYQRDSFDSAKNVLRLNKQKQNVLGGSGNAWDERLPLTCTSYSVVIKCIERLALDCLKELWPWTLDW